MRRARSLLQLVAGGISRCDTGKGIQLDSVVPMNSDYGPESQGRPEQLEFVGQIVEGKEHRVRAPEIYKGCP